MRKIIATSVFIIVTALIFPIGNSYNVPITPITQRLEDETEILFNQMKLDGIVDYKAFKSAYKGFKKLNNNNNNLLTIIDFNLPSTQKRLFVLDLANKELLYTSYVAHGRNSGENYATSFSNINGSYKSSLGFYRTAETYNGGNGYSLRLDGLEKGINDMARPRAVVIHGANYCSESFIKSTGRLGRSFGCPALPNQLNKPIIDKIKNGSILFIFADNSEYNQQTTII
ncbi:MAG: murein L,D-transpeptidase catalytic domain family protein [Fermentimonas sp.]|jgi:hypothetical protein